MQKMNVGYLVKLYLIPLALFAACIVMSILLVQSASETVCVGLLTGGCFGVILTFVFVPTVLRKRMEQKAEELEATFPHEGFTYHYKFTAHNAIFYIDAGGRLGILWRDNPARLQFADLRNLTDVRVHDGKILGGTSLVRTMFKLDGKQYNIHTFRAHRQRYSMKSNEVLEAISKADQLCELLNTAKQAALRQTAG